MSTNVIKWVVFETFTLAGCFVERDCGAAVLVPAPSPAVCFFGFRLFGFLFVESDMDCMVLLLSRKLKGMKTFEVGSVKCHLIFFSQ
jgi:hypothetical protein